MEDPRQQQTPTCLGRMTSRYVYQRPRLPSEPSCIIRQGLVPSGTVPDERYLRAGLMTQLSILSYSFITIANTDLSTCWMCIHLEALP
jgi:hypothetical protein